MEIEYTKALKEIQSLKDEINRIYMIGQFEIAESFDIRLKKIRKLLLEDISNYYIKNMLYTEIGYLEFDIKLYFSQKGNDEEIKNRVRLLKFELKTTIENDQGWDKVKKIVDEWRKKAVSSREKEEANIEIAIIVEEMIEKSLINGENVNLNYIFEFCETSKLINVTRGKLEKNAKKKDGKEQKDIFREIAYLDEEGLTNIELWKLIIQTEIKGTIELTIEKKQKVIANEEAKEVFESIFKGIPQPREGSSKRVKKLKKIRDR